MPDLPMDGQTDSVPAALPSVDEVSQPEEVQPFAKNQEPGGSPEVEHGPWEEEITVMEEPSNTEPQLEPQEGASTHQQDESGGVEMRRQGEGMEEQTEAPVHDAEDEDDGGEETQPNPAAVTTDETIAESTSQEAPAEPSQGATEEVTEGGDRSCTSCTCQSLFSNYTSHPPSRRKNRPCSLPVSELETVIASACGEPETPRSHYIRIHHLLHSLPSAQVRPRSQEEEAEEGENTSSTSMSVTPKTSKDIEDEGQKDDEEEDTAQSPSQVRPPMAT